MHIYKHRTLPINDFTNDVISPLLLKFQKELSKRIFLLGNFNNDLLKYEISTENFSKNSNLDDSGISLTVLPSKTNLKQHSISITPQMIKKVIMDLDLSKISSLDCIPVVVLKNCEPELSYIPADVSEEDLFSRLLKVSSVVPAFKNVGERYTAKNCRPVSLLSVVSKVFERTCK